MLWIISLVGKLVITLSRQLGRGHGSALPGLVVEKIHPSFLAKLMTQLSDGVVLVSGTNGKTTTTKVIVDLLTADGYRVFTNSSGSNYTRGVIAAALAKMKRGRLAADIAVLELDEAYATQFVKQVQPRYSLLLNVLRDQLDRFGEIDTTARLLSYVAERTVKTVVTNVNDPRLQTISSNQKVTAQVSWFGYSGKASRLYRTDEELHGHKERPTKLAAPASSQAVLLTNLTDHQAVYSINHRLHSVELSLFGIHNALNCAAAVAMLREIEGKSFDAAKTVASLAAVQPAFGRGEVITVGKSEVQLILVKNPSGFQLSLASTTNTPALIAINDAYADGRDVSWLWDVSFTNLIDSGPIMITGVRANDMALRLEYDEVPVGSVETNLTQATARFVNNLPNRSGQIFATYTAMLKIRQILEQMALEANNG